MSMESQHLPGDPVPGTVIETRLNAINDALKSSYLSFRDECLNKCGWSEATYYRRLNSGKLTAKEIETINSIAGTILKDLQNVIKIA